MHARTLLPLVLSLPMLFACAAETGGAEFIVEGGCLACPEAMSRCRDAVGSLFDRCLATCFGRDCTSCREYDLPGSPAPGSRGPCPSRRPSASTRESRVVGGDCAWTCRMSSSYLIGLFSRLTVSFSFSVLYPLVCPSSYPRSP